MVVGKCETENEKRNGAFVFVAGTMPSSDGVRTIERSNFRALNVDFLILFDFWLKSFIFPGQRGIDSLGAKANPRPLSQPKFSLATLSAQTQERANNEDTNEGKRTSQIK